MESREEIVQTRCPDCGNDEIYSDTRVKIHFWTYGKNKIVFRFEGVGSSVDCKCGVNFGNMAFEYEFEQAFKKIMAEHGITEFDEDNSREPKIWRLLNKIQRLKGELASYSNSSEAWSRENGTLDLLVKTLWSEFTVELQRQSERIPWKC